MLWVDLTAAEWGTRGRKEDFYNHYLIKSEVLCIKENILKKQLILLITNSKCVHKSESRKPRKERKKNLEKIDEEEQKWD